MQKLNFVSDLHLACAKDQLRPIMQCVHFKDGYAYASNSNIMVKQSLELSNVIEKELLVDKSIHKDSFKSIRKYQYVTANEDGFDCVHKDGSKAFFPFTELEDKIPDFEAVIPKGILSTPEVGINTQYLSDLGKSMANGNSVRLSLNGATGGILVTPLIDDVATEIGVIMPCMFN